MGCKRIPEAEKCGLITSEDDISKTSDVLFISGVADEPSWEESRDDMKSEGR